jgi:hypothetical protein
MATSPLLQPGVEVIQEFRTVSPTILTPTLVPCAIAPAFQVVDALTTNAAGSQVANSAAVVSVPALLTSANPAPFTGMNGLVLNVSINNGPIQTFTFSDPTALGLDAGQVCDQIASQSPAGFGAYVVDRDGTNFVELRTTATGDGQYLKVLAGSANTVLGFADGYQAAGVSTYNQTAVQIEQDNFPDPLGLDGEQVVDTDSIRVFINRGSSLQELSRSQTFLRNKKKVTYNTSTSVSFPVGPATFVGMTVTFQQGLQGTVETYTMVSNPTNIADLVTALNALFAPPSASTPAAVASAVGNTLALTSEAGYLYIGASTIDAYFGWTPGDTVFTLNVVDDGDGDATSPIIQVASDNFATPAGPASITGTVAVTAPLAVHNKTILMSVDGGPQQELLINAGPIVGATGATNVGLDGLTFNFTVNGNAKACTFSSPAALSDAIDQINAAAGITVCYVVGSGTTLQFQVGGATAIEGGAVTLVYGGSADDTLWGLLSLSSLVTSPTASVVYQTITLSNLVSEINAIMGAGFASIFSTHLVLSSSINGAESEVRLGMGTANSDLGFTDNAVANGLPYAPKVGDAVYADGAFIGNVAAVAPGGDSTKLKLNQENALTFTAQAMFIEAMNIPLPIPSDRPTPDLVIDLSGAVLVKMEVLRDTEGFALSNASGSLIIQYKALRLDVTPQSKTPALLNFSDIITLETALGPLTTDNPLALMLYFMMLNAPGVTISGVGVPDVSTAEPDGTVAGYEAALTFLEAQEVYALAPGSQEGGVHQACVSHVVAMSAPEAGGERVVFINPAMPDEALPALVGSGEGDSLPSTNWFDTHIASLASDLLAKNINPVGTISVDDGLYLTVAGETAKYNIAQVSGTRVLVRVAFAPGQNDDGFYSTSNLPSTLISDAFTIYIRGAKLVTSTGAPDYDAIAQAYADTGASYLNRRVRMTAPQNVGAIVNGTEALLPGYYMCSALAGMVGQLPPQQGFTNYPITGFTSVVGSNDVFSRQQMNVGAGGGTWWVIQSTAGAPLQTRMQVTTDLTSVETREHSITSIVDFVAKFMRAGLRNFIGRFNITQPFLDSLSTVVQGQLAFLREAGILVGGDLNNLVQDSTAPDTVLVDVTLDVPYPCNYIRLTLLL